MKVLRQCTDPLVSDHAGSAASASKQQRSAANPLPGFGKFVVSALLTLSFALPGCVNNAQVDGVTAVDLPEFVGYSRSPSGNGVDLCLHSSAVRRNPRSNPNLAWDDEYGFTIMGHGLTESKHGPILLDERLDKILNITPSRLSDIVKEDPGLRMKLSRARYVLMYCCHSGAETAEGMPSFASQLAYKLKKPVIAPTNKLTMYSGRGVVSDEGTYEVFYPRKRTRRK